MIADDRQEKERVDVRNALEEYVYDLRSKLLDDDQLATFITESDKNELCRLLDDTENWLYEEGEDCQRQIYSDRLARLKVSFFFSNLYLYNNFNINLLDKTLFRTLNRKLF